MRQAFASVNTIVFLSGLILSGQLSSSLALGQSAEPPPPFDVADVHASKPGTTELTDVFLAGGRVDVRGASMLELISIAYQVENNRVVGGPPWLDTDRFDIAAKAAASLQEDSLRPMLQALLADRFKLAIRKEERPLPVFALTVGKRGLKLKESAGDGPSNCKGGGGGAAMRTEACQHVTMAELAQQLRGMANAYIDHPVVDMTGLMGAYDFDFTWTPRGQLRKSTGDAEQGSGVSFFDAVDKQLGLKLEAQKQPMTVIVVEHVNQKPADNPAGVTRSLSATPTDFEVATIRVSKPGTTQEGSRLLQSGRLELPGITLKDLIMFAYDVEDDMMMGKPKWMDSDRFDLVAKAQSAVSFETLQTMLQKLLADRFKLAVHKEEQPVSVYAFTPGKRSAKLKEADGSNRSECKRSTGDGVQIYTCQNTTITQLAERLRNVARGYLDHPVVDLTGLKGSYDFELRWAARNRFTAAGRGGDTPGGVAAAADPNGDITLFEAVDKYLGLKLAVQKHPMPVIVIDHVERTPTEN